MSVAKSPVDICNLSQAIIGQARISSISPPKSNAEQYYADAYDTCRQSLIRKFNWNFANTEATITKNTDIPLARFRSSYTLPGDFVRLLEINGSPVPPEDGDPPVTTAPVGGWGWNNKNFKLVKNRKLLLCGTENSVVIQYLYDAQDVGTWDALFKRLMALELALFCGYAITGKDKITQMVEGLIARETPDAVSIDGQEDPPRRRQVSKYLAARRRGTGYDDGRWILGPQFDSLP